MNIKIDYNTISFGSQISCSDKTIHGNLKQTIEDSKDKRITDWFEKFINRIKEESNNDNFSIEINGCDFYEKVFIESVLERENGLINRIKIDFEEEDVVRSKYKNIDAFLDYVLNSQEGILKDAIKPNVSRIKNLRSNKVEVPVIATMSSGKSTLLNAIIGQDLLFEDTGAATATTCNIKINNELKEFVAHAIDGEKIIDKSSSNIRVFLEKWNSSANTKKFSQLKLNLEGPVKGLNSSNLQLNFIDTPGPNSAQNEHHKETTFNYLKDNTKLPIVLYVLDPEKMDSKDDDMTLKEISSVLKNNKENLDRIVFIYNKVDREVDQNRACSDVIIKIRKFLKNYEIENPQIFPVSSKYAKLAQLNRTLSYIEEGDLDNYRRKFIPLLDRDHLGYPLLEHSPLSANQKRQLEARILKSKLDADMVYSGLAAIKLYIEDYIINHHQKNQYKDLMGIAYNIFRLIENKIKLDKLKLEEKSSEEQKKNKEKYQKEIDELNIKKTEALQAIGKIKLDKGFIQDAIRKIDKYFNALNNKSFRKNSLDKNVAEQIIKEANATIQNLLVSIKTDLIGKMNEEKQRYLLRLKNEVVNKFQLKDPSLETKTFNAELLNKINVLDINNIDNYKRTEIEIKQIEVEKEVKSEKWYKRLFGFTDTITVIENYKVPKTVINGAKLYDDVIDPISQEFNNIVKASKSDFDKMFHDYNNSFKELVNFSFHEAENSVYKQSVNELTLSNKEKESHLQKLREIDKAILQFKIQ